MDFSFLGNEGLLPKMYEIFGSEVHLVWLYAVQAFLVESK